MSTLPATLNSLVERMSGAIARAVIDRYPPRYTPRVRAELGFETGLESLRRKPLGAQADIVRALAMELRDGRSALLVAEMGTGKTCCAIAAAHLADTRRILVFAPPHLVQKWKREVECTLRLLVAPAIVRTPTELERALHAGSFAKQLWMIVPETAAKLGYGWRPAAVPRRRFRNSVLACPDCGAPVQDREGNLLGVGELSRRKLRCLAPSPRGDGPCDAALLDCAIFAGRS